jgi:lipoyl(octanoyl) transferase
VHLSRWVTSHGFAYNVSTDLRYFDLIVPCGIAGARVTSLERILGRGVETGDARARIISCFGEVFGLSLQPMSPEEFRVRLGQLRNPTAEAVTATV